MIRYNILRKVEYKNSWVYVLQFHRIFQYLLVYKGEIFQNHIVMTGGSSWIYRILWVAGRRPHPFTKDEIDEGTTVILNAAMTTIDTLRTSNHDPILEDPLSLKSHKGGA